MGGPRCPATGANGVPRPLPSYLEESCADDGPELQRLSLELQRDLWGRMDLKQTQRQDD